MGENSNKPDVLLSKLDSLMKSGRVENRSHTPPILTQALPDELQGQIPTLTDAIGNRRIDPDSCPDQGAQKVQDVIASRLVASVDHEIADLLTELPALQDKLAVLHRSLRFALTQLVNVRWNDDDAEDDDAESEIDAGSDPDQLA